MNRITANAFAQFPFQFNFFQIAYVTTDLDQAARAMGALFGIERFQINRDVAIETSAGVAQAHFALAFVGSQQIEIIQPAGGADGAYRDILPGVGYALRMHHAGHLATRAADWAQIDLAVRTSGYTTPVGGVFRRDEVALMHYMYADTRQVIGHYLEFMYQTDAGRDMFAQVPRY
jgi:hypothetical protein